MIGAVKQELATINANLPEGVEVQPYYDRATLVKAAVSTVINALLQGLFWWPGAVGFMGGLRPAWWWRCRFRSPSASPSPP